MTPTEQSVKIELQSPFPRELYKVLQRWLYQFPNRAVDDSWPDSTQLCEEMDRRGEQEYTCAVIENGTPVGFIGYMNISGVVGSLRGVCFTQEVHGNGTAARALRQVLQQQFDAGIHKVLAFPFADNHRARAFYKKLGATDEMLLREHAFRGGVLTDMMLLTFFARSDGYCSGA